MEPKASPLPSLELATYPYLPEPDESSQSFLSQIFKVCDIVASAFGKYLYGSAMRLPTGVGSVTQCSVQSCNNHGTVVYCGVCN